MDKELITTIIRNTLIASWATRLSKRDNIAPVADDIYKAIEQYLK